MVNNFVARLHVGAELAVDIEPVVLVARIRPGFGADARDLFLGRDPDRLGADERFGDLPNVLRDELIERRGATNNKGVSGSLGEMSLPDMVQILWHGRKTCALKIQAGSSNGEIDFAEGQVVNARWQELRGEEAFYKMLSLQEGDFRLDPSYKPTVRVISASPEALLLEGMRRLDEAAL